MRHDISHFVETRDAAHALHALDYHLVPIAYGGKTPLIAWRDAECDHRLIGEWFDRFGPHLNIAIHAGRSEIIGLDADTTEAAAWIEEHCPPTPMNALTPRGGTHAYFRAPADGPPPATDLFGIGLDARSGASLLIASPSYSREHGRRWEWQGAIVPPSELPVIDARLIRREPLVVPKSPLSARPTSGSIGPIRDVTRWIMGVPSVQGNFGSNGCYKVACKLVDAGLSYEEAMHWFRAWNARVPEPPWSERELARKLDDAFRR